MDGASFSGYSYCVQRRANHAAAVQVNFELGGMPMKIRRGDLALAAGLLVLAGILYLLTRPGKSEAKRS